jgi:hypothetical protein
MIHLRRWSVWIALAGWLTLAGCTSPMHTSSWNPLSWFGSKSTNSKPLPGDMIPPAKDVGLAAGKQ